MKESKKRSRSFLSTLVLPPSRYVLNTLSVDSSTMSVAPPSASKLSHLSTTILTSVLELQRLHQLSLPASASLTSTITRNISQLVKGIDQLEEAGSENREVLVGLQQQEERIIGLVQGLGVKVEQSTKRGKDKGRTGKLVDTGDEEVDPFSLGFVDLLLSQTPCREDAEGRLVEQRRCGTTGERQTACLDTDVFGCQNESRVKHDGRR